jgi:hypothetical protein
LYKENTIINMSRVYKNYKFKKHFIFLKGPIENDCVGGLIINQTVTGGEIFIVNLPIRREP